MKVAFYKEVWLEYDNYCSKTGNMFIYLWAGQTSCQQVYKYKIFNELSPTHQEDFKNKT